MTASNASTRLALGPADAIVVAGALAFVASRDGGKAVGNVRQARGAARNSGRAQCMRRLARGRDEQTKRPDGTAVRVDAAGGLEHGRFAFAPQAADALAQGKLRTGLHFDLRAGQRHGFKRGAQRRAWATASLRQ
ncbi:hypothetical protein DL770_011341 [Monosporascus sp. CRB-9-2]|nr:hypothetical protein DL770_011341 [Monosporascus sp. CRB-9-2]